MLAQGIQSLAAEDEQFRDEKGPVEAVVTVVLLQVIKISTCCGRNKETTECRRSIHIWVKKLLNIFSQQGSPWGSRQGEVKPPLLKADKA